jgi:hypothetical protein
LLDLLNRLAEDFGSGSLGFEFFLVFCLLFRKANVDELDEHFEKCLIDDEFADEVLEPVDWLLTEECEDVDELLLLLVVVAFDDCVFEKVRVRFIVECCVGCFC